MTRRIDRPTVSRHVQLYEEDWEFIEANFGKHTSRPVGAAQFVRNVVHARVRSLRQSQTRAIDELSRDESQADLEIMRKIVARQ